MTSHKEASRKGLPDVSR